MVLKHNKYLYISIPLERPSKASPIYNAEIVALDPGERGFVTMYNPYINGVIGAATRERFLKVMKEGDKIRAKMDKLKTKLKTNDCNRRAVKQKLRQLKRKWLSAVTKPTRLARELHNKTALFLCKNFQTIVVPEYRTSELSELPAVVNRANRALSHYTFRQRLIHKASQYGRQVHLIPESYTTVTCTKCGFVNEKTKDEYLVCKQCKLKSHRDVSGSRNLYIKSRVVINEIKSRLASRSGACESMLLCDDFLASIDEA